MTQITEVSDITQLLQEKHEGVVTLGDYIEELTAIPHDILREITRRQIEGKEKIIGREDYTLKAGVDYVLTDLLGAGHDSYLYRQEKVI